MPVAAPRARPPRRAVAITATRPLLPPHHAADADGPPPPVAAAERDGAVRITESPDGDAYVTLDLARFAAPEADARAKACLRLALAAFYAPSAEAWHASYGTLAETIEQEVRRAKRRPRADLHRGRGIRAHTPADRTSAWALGYAADTGGDHADPLLAWCDANAARAKARDAFAHAWSRPDALELLAALAAPRPTFLRFEVAPTGALRAQHDGPEACDPMAMRLSYASSRRVGRWVVATSVLDLGAAVTRVDIRRRMWLLLDRLCHSAEQTPLAPLAASLLWFADQQARACDVEAARLTRMLTRCWNQMLRAIEPRLDPRLARLTRQCRGSLETYQLFVSSPALADYAAQAPVFGAMLTPAGAAAIPRGTSLREALRLILEQHPEVVRAAEDYAGLAAHERADTRNELSPAFVQALRVDAGRLHLPPASAGFVAWARAVRWTPAFCPGLRTAAAQLVLKVYAAHDRLDPNRLRHVRGPAQWFLLNYLLLRPFTPTYAVKMLHDPAASAAAVYGYYGPDRGGYRGWAFVHAVWSEITDARWAAVRAFNAGDQTALTAHDNARSLTRLVELARRYHRNGRRGTAYGIDARQEALLTARAHPMRFPMPPLLTARRGTTQLIWLGSNVALAEEGVRMSHCVGGYAQQCRDGWSIIYRVTHAKTGEALGTLEVDGRFRVRQLRGPHNHAVSDKVSRAVTALLTPWQERFASEAWEAIDPRRPATRHLPTAAAAELGFDDADFHDLPF